MYIIFLSKPSSNLEEIYPVKKAVDVPIKIEDHLSKLKSSHGFGSLVSII